MAREEREQRPARPSSVHPIGAAIYDFQRNTWGRLFGVVVEDGITGEAKAQYKALAIGKLQAIIAQIEAL